MHVCTLKKKKLLCKSKHSSLFILSLLLRLKSSKEIKVVLVHEVKTLPFSTNLKIFFSSTKHIQFYDNKIRTQNIELSLTLDNGTSSSFSVLTNAALLLPESPPELNIFQKNTLFKETSIIINEYYKHDKQPFKRID